MKIENIVSALAAQFPESNGVYSKAQVLTVVPYIPPQFSRIKDEHGTYPVQNFGNPVMSKPKAPKVVRMPEPQAPQASQAETGVSIKTGNVMPERASLIPSKDDNYIPFGSHRDLTTVIKSNQFYPVYISGPSGVGKSCMVEQVCSAAKRPLIRVNINMMSDEDQLIGSKTLKNGDIEVVYGPVLIAMKLGAVLLLDECDAGAPNTLLCLQPILEGKPYYFKLNNEVITPAPGFTIIATANTKGKGNDDGKYVGTNVLNEAFLERFAITMEQTYPNINTESRIIKILMEANGCWDEKFHADLVKWVDAIRKTYDDGGVDDNISTRRIAHMVRAFSIFKDPIKAVSLCCNRFDELTKAAFIDLFTKISGNEQIPQPEEAV